MRQRPVPHVRDGKQTDFNGGHVKEEAHNSIHLNLDQKAEGRLSSIPTGQISFKRVQNLVE